MRNLSLLLFALLPFVHAAAMPVELSQDKCGKRGCPTWITVKGKPKDRLRLKPLSGEFGRLKEGPKETGPRIRPVIDGRKYEWPKGQLAVEIVQLDAATLGLLVSTQEGVETVKHAWKLYLFENGFREILSGKAGRHSPATVHESHGFVTTGASLGYYVLKYYWLFESTTAAEAAEVDGGSFHEFATKRWDAKSKTFGDAGKDPIDLWAVIPLSRADYAGFHAKAIAMLGELRAKKCFGEKNPLRLVRTNGFTKLTPNQWALASFTVERATAERLRETIEECLPSAKVAVTRAD